LRPLSLLGTSGNGRERHWKTNHCSQRLLEHAIAHLSLVATPWLARRDGQRPDPLQHRAKQALGRVALASMSQ
jgi:hypothetical protein